MLKHLYEIVYEDNNDSLWKVRIDRFKTTGGYHGWILAKQDDTVIWTTPLIRDYQEVLSQAKSTLHAINRAVEHTKKV